MFKGDFDLSKFNVIIEDFDKVMIIYASSSSLSLLSDFFALEQDDTNLI